ncbi:MAG TPA: cytochrome c [Candidatus Methylomirabilis sp.]|nr:cytochrome c [Candidatus Methylomirabilis sp.]
MRRFLVIFSLLISSAGVARAAGEADVARGKYIFGATGGCGCHTEPRGKPNAGGRRFDGPFGTVYSTNITPDRETGIGRWTDEQIITAIRLGRRPDGERILPVHPFTSFSGMADDDAKALASFLRTVPPVNRPNTPKKIAMPLFESVFLPAWIMTFATMQTAPSSAPVAGLPRGEYLVRAVGHCGECHTPRSALTMALDNRRLLAGNSKRTGPEGQAAPNITPDRQTGLGEWTEEQIATFLATGNRPDGDVAGGLMGENIQGTLAGYKDMTPADLQAIARYLKAIPAVSNRIGESPSAPPAGVAGPARR